MDFFCCFFIFMKFSQAWLLYAYFFIRLLTIMIKNCLGYCFLNFSLQPALYLQVIICFNHFFCIQKTNSNKLLKIILKISEDIKTTTIVIDSVHESSKDQYFT